MDNTIIEIEQKNHLLLQDDKIAKYNKMATSPYYFFRGTNHLFWKKYAQDSRLLVFGNEKTRTWIQGDLHPYNFGMYDNNRGEIVYDLNDFDESLIADYQFDLWRMASAMCLIAQENGLTDSPNIKKIIEVFAQQYLKTVFSYIDNKEALTLCFTKDNTYGKLNDELKKVEEKCTQIKMLNKWTVLTTNNRIFDLSNEKLESISEDKQHEIIAQIPAYHQTMVSKIVFNDNNFKVIDITKRVSSGTGSHGLPRYYILINGENNNINNIVILDVKKQNKPTAYDYLTREQQYEYDARFSNEGRRHAMAYLAMSHYTDSYLGWIELSEGVFSVRKRSAYKEYFPTQKLDNIKKFLKLSAQWAKVLATNHCRAYPYFDKETIQLLSTNKESEFENLVCQIAFEFTDYINQAYQIFKNRIL